MTVAQATTLPPVTPSRTLGLLAAGMAAACAITLGLVASLNRTPSPPAEFPAGLVLTALLLTPPAIGALGAIYGQRVLLLAAAILCLAQSVIAFSGVTLVLILPGLLFMRAGLSGGRNAARRLRPRDAIVGVAAVGLVIGAMVAAFGLTQTICWNARQTPAGLIYERIPVRDESITVDGGVSTYDGGVSTVGSGCSSGEATIEGTALAAALLIGAVATSALAARTRRNAAP